MGFLNFKKKNSKKEVVDASNEHEMTEEGISSEFATEDGVMDGHENAVTDAAKKKGGGNKKRIVKIAAASILGVVVLVGLGITYVTMGGSGTTTLDDTFGDFDKATRETHNSGANDTSKELATEDDFGKKKMEEPKKEVVATVKKAETPIAPKTEKADEGKSVTIKDETLATVAKVDVLVEQKDPIVTMKDIDDITKKTDSAEDIVLSSLAIGGDGKMDPFLQQMQETVNNNQKVEVLASNIRLLDKSVEFLNKKLEHDRLVETYRQKAQQFVDRDSVKDLRKSVEQQNREVYQMLQEVRKEAQQIRDELTAKMQHPLEQAPKNQQNSDNVSEFREYNGIIFGSNNKMYLSPVYQGRTMSQTIYRIGDSFILEESDEIGNAKTYRVGSNYRGGLIVSIGADIISLNINGTTHIISVGSSMGQSSLGYNYIQIKTPASSSIKNAENVRMDRNSGPRDYYDVQEERRSNEPPQDTFYR